MRLKELIKLLSASLYYILIIITVPLSLDIGGEQCCLAYTLTLSTFYFVMSSVRMLCNGTKLAYLGSILYYFHHFMIPSLLIIHLDVFSGTAGDASTAGVNVPPLWLHVIQPWKYIITNFTPFFTVLEGFCTVLVIQAVGRSLKSKQSDIRSFIQIVFASVTTTTSLYFLYRIYYFPIVIEWTDAAIVTAGLLLMVLVAGYGIASSRGSPLESALLCAYIVYCLYITFTDFESDIQIFSLDFWLLSDKHEKTTAKPSIPQIPPLPPLIMDSYDSVLKVAANLAQSVPSGFVTVFYILRGALSTITPSVFVALAYRVTVLLLATRIVPSISSQKNNGQSSHKKSGLLTLIVYAYAPCIVIAVYTNLLMQHAGILSFDLQWLPKQTPWQWINAFCTLILYGLEISNSSVNLHLKSD